MPCSADLFVILLVLGVAIAQRAQDHLAQVQELGSVKETDPSYYDLQKNGYQNSVIGQQSRPGGVFAQQSPWELQDNYHHQLPTAGLPVYVYPEYHMEMVNHQQAASRPMPGVQSYQEPNRQGYPMRPMYSQQPAVKPVYNYPTVPQPQGNKNPPSTKPVYSYPKVPQEQNNQHAGAPSNPMPVPTPAVQPSHTINNNVSTEVPKQQEMYNRTQDHNQIAFTESTPALTNLRALRPIVSRGLLELCLRLEQVSRSPDSTENTVLAPLSIAGVTALLLAGSRGQTKHELEGLFGVANVPHEPESLHRTLSNIFSELEASEQTAKSLSHGSGLFLQEGEPISKEFLQLAKEVYRSEVISVDFRKASQDTAALINRWVANRTEGMIQSLIKDAVEPTTSMIIANVFFFRASWEQPFVQKFTKMQKFHVSRSESIPLPLMVGTMTVPYSRVRGSHALVGLPYKGGDSLMYFILPDGDLRTFVAGLNPETLRGYVNQTVTQQTIVAIPRMRVEGSLELYGPLTELGAGSVFRAGAADLSGIGKNFHVSEMLHKVTLEVTETGTVGAAATAVNILRDGSTPVFRADRPFLFFVYHRPTGSILFWGTIFRPEGIEAI